MAIAKLPSSTPTPVDPVSQIKENVKINDKPSSTTPWVNTASGQTDSVLGMQVAGSPWKGNYYQQLKEIDDVADTIDDRIDSAHQQYSKINNYVAKMQGDLNYSITEDTKETTVTGEMILTDTLIPNRGDLWVAEFGTNRIGVFAVTETERLSAFNGSAYRASIHLVETSDVRSLGDKYTSLESKTISNYYYDANYLYLGTKATLSSDEVHYRTSLRNTAKRMVGDHIREFFDRTASTIVLTIGSETVYDPNIVEFILKTFKSGTGPIRNYKEANANPATIWDNLIERNPLFSNFIMDKFELAVMARNHDLPFLYGLQHTLITYIVRTRDSDDPSAVTDSSYSNAGCTTDEYAVTLDSLTTITPNISDTVVPPIPAVGLDNSYVMSTEWYTGDYDTSILESAVSDWLNNEPISTDKLISLQEASRTFSTIERFYLNPIVIFLLSNSL